jgi:hypothetical protein
MKELLLLSMEIIRFDSHRATRGGNTQEIADLCATITHLAFGPRTAANVTRSNIRYMEVCTGGMVELDIDGTKYILQSGEAIYAPHGVNVIEYQQGVTTKVQVRTTKTGEGTAAQPLLLLKKKPSRGRDAYLDTEIGSETLPWNVSYGKIRAGASMDLETGTYLVANRIVQIDGQYVNQGALILVEKGNQKPMP